MQRLTLLFTDDYFRDCSRTISRYTPYTVYTAASKPSPKWELLVNLASGYTLQQGASVFFCELMSTRTSRFKLQNISSSQIRHFLRQSDFAKYTLHHREIQYDRNPTEFDRLDAGQAVEFC